VRELAELAHVYEPIDLRSIAELVPASPTPTLPYPKQTYNFIHNPLLPDMASALGNTRPVGTGPLRGWQLPVAKCCDLATPTWKSSPIENLEISMYLT